MPESGRLPSDSITEAESRTSLEYLCLIDGNQRLNYSLPLFSVGVISMEKIRTNVHLKEIYKQFRATRPWAEDSFTDFLDHVVHLGLLEYGAVA